MKKRAKRMKHTHTPRATATISKMTFKMMRDAPPTSSATMIEVFGLKLGAKQPVQGLNMLT